MQYSEYFKTIYLQITNKYELNPVNPFNMSHYDTWLWRVLHAISTSKKNKYRNHYRRIVNPRNLFYEITKLILYISLCLGLKLPFPNPKKKSSTWNVFNQRVKINYLYCFDYFCKKYENKLKPIYIWLAWNKKKEKKNKLNILRLFTVNEKKGTFSFNENLKI